VVWAVSLSTTKLSPRRLTHRLLLLAFAVCLGLVTSTWPRAHAALYLQKSRPVAAPQCISGRTSYLHVRLAFHPYPQLIPQFCNTGGCGPRRTVTSASPWPWIAHVVSGPIVATRARPLQTRFPCGSPALTLVTLATTMHSPDHSTKGTPSALTPTTGEWPLTACQYAVSGTLSSPSRGAFHLSLTVLVHYRSLKVLSLGGWSPLLPTNSPGFVVLRIPARLTPLPLRDSHLLRWCLPAPSSRSVLRSAGPTTPPALASTWFGLFPSRSPLLRESRLISSRRATEMFQFAHCPLPAYAFSRQCPVITPGGLPHSDSQGSSLACSSP
jgi:hypothetical protein